MSMKYLTAIILSLICFDVLAQDNTGYYGFYQYRNFGAKMSADYFPSPNEPDPSAAKRFFPSVLSKELTYLKNNNRTTKEAISYGDWDKPYRIMFGIEQDMAKSKTSKSSYGGNDDSYNAFFLIDKLQIKNWRLGGGINFNHFQSEFNPDNMELKQQNIMAILYSVYNNAPQQIRIRNVLYLGNGSNELRRSGNGIYDTKFSSQYYSLENTISKTFNISSLFYLQTSGELNYLGIRTNSIKEDNGFSLKRSTNYEIDGLIGVFAGIKYKNFNLKSGPELNHIFSDPRKAFYLYNENNDAIPMKKKHEQKNYVVYKTYLTYKYNDNLGF